MPAPFAYTSTSSLPSGGLWESLNVLRLGGSHQQQFAIS